MTREELIERICPTDNVSECCRDDCTFVCDDCKDILVQMLAEYEKQIREKAFDDGMAKIEEMLSRVFNDEDDYYLGIENGYQDCIRELEQLKGE